MKRRAFVAGAAASACVPGVALAAATPKPTAAPDPGAAMDAYMATALRFTPAVGVTIAVGRSGAVTVARAYGQADRERNVAATTATRYRVGSLTKQFTAALVLRETEAGTLGLDDRLARFVPEYAHASEITLRQMLQQISGIPRDVTRGFDSVFASTTPARVIAKLSGFPLDFTPGSQFEYANLNYYLLGVVLERATHASYADLLSTHILGPLGLHDTFLEGARPDAAVASGYVVADEGFNAAPPWNFAYTFAAGGLISTAADLVTWNAALRGGKVISAASYATMTTKPALPAGQTTEYAMGLVVNDRGKAERIWHNGEVGGGHAMDAHYLDVDYDVVVLCNTNGARALSPEHTANVVVGIVAPSSAFADPATPQPPQPKASMAPT